MRSILEKAIVHLLNEEQDKAEALFHKFMVERARQIHESLRQGEEVVLNEGWDDEITTEEYFTEADLDDAEDADVDGEGDAAVKDDAATIADDLAGDAEAPEAESDLGDEAEGEVEERLSDIEDEIAKLTAEFEALMSEIDGDHPDAEGDDAVDGGAEDDLGDAEDTDVSAEGGDEVAADTAEAPAGDEFAADKDGEEVQEDDEFDDLDEITESVIAELEKVAVSLENDGKEVGDGKTVTQNSKSVLPTSKANVNDAKPVTVKSDKHEGFEREPAPAVKPMPKRKNNKAKAEDGRSTVPAEGDKSAVLNKDFADKTQK